MASEDERITPPVTQVGEKIAGSKTTKVYEQDKTGILKEFSGIYQFPRLPDESDDDYRKRRLEKCFLFIKNALASEAKTRLFLPKKGINAPEEYHFIANGKDGFPTPLRVQERVLGQTLKKVDHLQLTEEQQNDLDALVQASLASYRQTGQTISLIGSAEDEKGGLIELIKKTWEPLKNSHNIMMSPDGTISLVDVRVLRKGSLANTLQYFVLFSYHYRRKLQQRLKPKTAQKKSPLT